MTRTKPTDITVSNAEQTMTILWADGHRTVYPLDGLRLACPCVTCKGGHDKMGTPVDPMVFHQPATQRREVTGMETVGGYGLQLYWEDGHHEGIYSWKMLRDDCPCSACNPFSAP